MGFIGGLVGGDSGNEGDAGMNYKAGSANIVNPVTPDQISASYNNAQAGLNNQSQFLTALQGQNGIANQSSVFNQQQALANQLQGVANGTGPNPALAQLNQTTSNNIANQAALMAGQRGTSQNAGLLARQAAIQGGNLQQQAAGQGATLQAQQQLNAMSALGTQQQALGNTAGTQVNNQAAATNAYATSAQQEQANLLNAQASYNNANVSNMSSQNSSNSSVANSTAKGQQSLLQSGGSALAALMAKGGMVGAKDIPMGKGPKSRIGKMYADGGAVTDEVKVQPIQASSGSDSSGSADSGGGSTGATQVAGLASMLAAGGGKVPGKATVKGNSYANDTVPAKLSPGEIVIPRSITMSDDPAGNAAKFVAATIAKQNKGSKKAK